MKIVAITSPIIILFLAIFSVNKDFSSTAKITKDPDFKSFIKNFDATSLPYSLDENVFYPSKDDDENSSLDFDTKPENIIEYDNLDFIPYKRPIYSRMGPDDYTYEAELALSKDYKAVIVGGMRAFSQNPHYFNIITYTNEGKVIDYQEVARFYGQREMKRCSISSDGTITIEHCDNTWKDGKLVATDITKIETIVIRETGTIEDANQPTIKVEQKEEEIIPSETVGAKMNL